MAELKYCQSCGLPFNEEHRKFISKEKDGSDSEYCTFCYKDGKFLNPEATAEEMIGIGVSHLANKIGEKAAREELGRFVPTLKRWRKV
ncbi:MAG: zinc ribbon domain-containing protein [Treponema sp.]|nr:zinc ribbon domain-containing protein [Treponema sp.]